LVGSHVKPRPKAPHFHVAIRQKECALCRNTTFARAHHCQSDLSLTSSPYLSFSLVIIMLPARPSPRAVGGLPHSPSRSNPSKPDREQATRRYGRSEPGGRSSSPGGYRSRQNTTTSSSTSGRERSRSRSRPRASTPENRQPGRVASSHRAHSRQDLPRHRTIDAPPSSASSSSSLLERMRAGRGYSSPRASLDEHDEGPKQGRPSQGRWVREGKIAERDTRADRRKILFFFTCDLYHLTEVFRIRG
jgi:hypothetical protein